MPRYQVAYVAACMAVTIGAIAYMLCDYGAWPKLAYLPYSRQWAVVRSPPTATTMMYPGMLLWGITGAFVGAAGSLFLMGRRSLALQSRSITLLGCWALSAITFSAGYFLWGLSPF